MSLKPKNGPTSAPARHTGGKLDCTSDCLSKICTDTPAIYALSDAVRSEIARAKVQRRLRPSCNGRADQTRPFCFAASLRSSRLLIPRRNGALQGADNDHWPAGWRFMRMHGVDRGQSCMNGDQID